MQDFDGTISIADPLVSSIYREAVVKPRGGDLPNEAAITAAQAALDGTLDAYETILSHSHWLAGPNLTLADIYHLPFGEKIVSAGHGAALLDAKKRPHVAK